MRKNAAKTIELEPCACGGPKSAKAKICQDCYEEQQTQLRGGIPLQYGNVPVNPTKLRLNDNLIRLRDRLSDQVKEQMRELYDVDSKQVQDRSYAHDQRMWKSREPRRKRIPENP